MIKNVVICNIFKVLSTKGYLLRRINSISKWPSLKNWKHPYFTKFQYRFFFDIKINPGGLLCLFCFYNEYILINKRNYKMKEIIPILVLKWYFQGRNFEASVALNFINLSWFSYKKTVICHLFKVLASKRIF